MTKKLSKRKIKEQLKVMEETNLFLYGKDPSKIKLTEKEKTAEFCKNQSVGDSRNTLSKRAISK